MLNLIIIQRLPELMIKAKLLSSQVSLIGHNDIVEMLHRPIYIQTEKKASFRLRSPKDRQPTSARVKSERPNLWAFLTTWTLTSSRLSTSAMQITLY